jgi:alpha-tubulin suppressor-like RCC1 family protein
MMRSGVDSRWRVVAVALLVLLLLHQGSAIAAPEWPAHRQAPGSTQGGSVFAWGNLRSVSEPPKYALQDVVAIAAGVLQASALTRDGRVISWGHPRFAGQVPLDAQSSVTHIAASGETSLALRSDGRVVAWTCRASCSSPTYVPDEARSDVISIAAGYNSAFAIRTDGELVAWGMPDAIVNKVTNGTPMPGVPGGGVYGIPLEAKTGVVAVAAGVRHALALTNSGRVVAWGYSDRGQLAVPEGASEGVIAISAGFYHSLALTSQGRVLAWGSNEAGQVTVPAEARAGIKEIAAGDTFSMALTEDGRVITWGGRDYPGPGEAPASVRSGVTKIAAGDVYGLAIKAGQTVTTPGPVVNLKARSAKGSLRITWLPPTDMGGANDLTYQYQVGRQAWKSISATSVTVRGPRGVKITVKVRVVNTAGFGPSVGVSGVPR